MNREQAKYHFMASAPPVPDWFSPKPNGIDFASCQTSSEWDREKLLQWPAYYAEEMLKRADEKISSTSHTVRNINDPL